MATAAKPAPHRRLRISSRRHVTLTVPASFSLVAINVDGISPADSATIKCGDSVLWHSPSGALFKIIAIGKKSGPGPAQPFQKHFPNSDNFSTQIYSGPAVQNNGTSHYKYTIKFKQGATIDPDVVIEQ